MFARLEPEEARTILDEHGRIRARISYLGAALDLHAVRLGMIRALAYELDAHARREDKLLYRWADEHVNELDRAPLLRALVRFGRGGPS